MCSEGPGSIVGADNLNSGFHPFGVGEMRSYQYTVGGQCRRFKSVMQARVHCNVLHRTYRLKAIEARDDRELAL